MRCLLLLLCPSLAFAGPIQVGAAQVDITPAKGTPMAGYYATRLAEGTLDKLYAKALVIEKDGTVCAMVSVDLIATTFDMCSQSSKLINEQTKIPATNVMIFATHAHTGPVLWIENNPRVQAFGGGNKLTKEYMDKLPGKIAEAVAVAHKSRQPVKVLSAIGKEEGLAFNRRFHMKDGTVGWNPGKLNPNIVKPAGPTDTSVPIVVFQTLDAKNPKVVATYVNFSMHSDTVGGLYFSADYPGHLAKALSKFTGEDSITFFGLGTCGNINHVNTGLARPQKGDAESARIGIRLAGAVLKAWDDLKEITDDSLVVSNDTLELAAGSVSTMKLEQAREIEKQTIMESKPAPKFLDKVAAFNVLEQYNRSSKPYVVNVQTITLGKSLAWVSLPGEVFVELGTAIKKGSPFPQTMINELANGSIGYIPNQSAYAEGNYEVISARVKEGEGERLVKSALQQLFARK